MILNWNLTKVYRNSQTNIYNEDNELRFLIIMRSRPSVNDSQIKIIFSRCMITVKKGKLGLYADFGYDEERGLMIYFLQSRIPRTSSGEYETKGRR